MLKIKNISKSAISIFYIKDGKTIRVTIKPGEEIFGDSARTPQVNHFQKIGKITVIENGVKSAPNNKVITHGAIYPQKKISKEEYLNMNTKNEFESKSILELIDSRAVDYNKVLENNVSVVHDTMDLFDVSAIIPVRGRNDFAEPMYKSFSVAAAKSGLKISYTMVEHSENPEHSKFCKKNRLNYIWIKSEPGELFNKCLAQNMGALFSSKSKYILFHDIDCLMQSDFFVRLFKNIRDKKARAIQNFTGRRVLYINPELTQKVIAGEFEVDDLSVELNEVNPPHIIGAPGGSITIERDLFFEIGGYDPEFFLANSPEDAFFWEKVNAIDKMYTSDAPDIELYHMFHPPTWNDNPYISGMLKIQNEFKSMNLEQKKEMIMLKAEAIKKFK